MRKILVTCALPYANGDIHLGHILEHIQADIWVRFLKMQNEKVYFVCADDAHGTPIMLKAQELGIKPEQLIAEVKQRHENDFKGFGIGFDNYHSTHSLENQQLAEEIYLRLFRGGYIKTRTISQLFDPEKEMFLPDRFVKGTCPKCKAPDQYGDNCEVCSTTYSPTELIDPKSAISGATPVIRESEHYFFDLPAFKDMLQNWIQSGTLQKEVSNKMQEWFESGLHQWDISRDPPYFGFKIPDTLDKYFYVWLDAPIGYMASFKSLCMQTQDIDFRSFWAKDSTAEIYHFIGKDIVYFHSLFWPAVLTGAGFRVPSNIFVHGYVTVNGEKMSKSRGTFIQASTYLKHLDPECLRYYYAAKLSTNVDDIDLNLEDFVQRVNSDIVNKLVNIASRNVSFINKRFNGFLANDLDDPELFNKFTQKASIIGDLYRRREYNKAIREIMTLCDLANKYIDEKAPWVLAKQEDKEEELHKVTSMGIQLFRILMGYLKPVLPNLANRAEEFLDQPLTWEGLQTPLINHRVNEFKPLFKRIEPAQIDALLAETKQIAQDMQKSAEKAVTKTAEKNHAKVTSKEGKKDAKNADKDDKRKDKKNNQKSEAKEDKKSENKANLKSDNNQSQSTTHIVTNATEETSLVSIDDFAKLDLRVGKVLQCEAVPESKKLLKFILDIGNGKTRQIFSGIKSAYPEPEKLVGRKVIFIANLAPRKMKFGISEGMILSALDGDKLFLLDVDNGANAGSQVG